MVRKDSPEPIPVAVVVRESRKRRAPIPPETSKRLEGLRIDKLVDCIRVCESELRSAQIGRHNTYLGPVEGLYERRDLLQRALYASVEILERVAGGEE